MDARDPDPHSRSTSTVGTSIPRSSRLCLFGEEEGAQPGRTSLQPARPFPARGSRQSAGCGGGRARVCAGRAPDASRGFKKKPSETRPWSVFNRPPPSRVPFSAIGSSHCPLEIHFQHLPPPTITADPRKCSVCFTQPFGDRKLGKSPAPERQPLRRGLRNKDTDFGGPMCAQRK